MTEADWMAGIDPELMVPVLDGTASHRKMQLLTVAVCRQIWPIIPPRCRLVVDALELYADGDLSDDEYGQAWSHADIECRTCVRDPPDATMYAAESVMISSPPTIASVSSALSTAAMAYGHYKAERAPDNEYDSELELGRFRVCVRQSRTIRDIFGNPYCPVIFDPRWRTEDTVGLAHGIYEDGAFDRLPLLGDALMDAGCDHEQVLAHCRGEGPHVRGCWVVDLVLGKE